MFFQSVANASKYPIDFPTLLQSLLQLLFIYLFHQTPNSFLWIIISIVVIFTSYVSMTLMINNWLNIILLSICYKINPISYPTSFFHFLNLLHPFTVLYFLLEIFLLLHNSTKFLLNSSTLVCLDFAWCTIKKLKSYNMLIHLPILPYTSKIIASHSKGLWLMCRVKWFQYM